MRQIRSLLSILACLTIGSVAACTTSTDPIPVASITLFPGLDSIELGETFDGWTVIVKDANGKTINNADLAWESNNKAVATVDPNTGVVTAVASGETLIIVRTGGQEATAAIRVLQPVLSVIVTPDSFDLPLTTSRQINVQLVGPNGVALTNRALVWSSDDPSVAVVSTTGVVTPVKLGTTTIKIRVADVVRASVRVRVVGEPVTTVRILPVASVHIIRLGQTKQLSAECLSATGQVLAGRSITWMSSNPAIATVTNNGLVTGMVVGSVNIGAACEGGASSAVTVHVTPIPVASVSIDPPTLSMQSGRQAQLNAIARDSTGAILSLQGRQVAWFSSNNPVAQVNTIGVVFSSNTGTAEITVSVDGITSPPAIVTVTGFFAMQSTPPWSRTVADLPDR